MRSEKTTESEMTFTTKQMADVLNLSARRVQQLAEDGVLIKSARGKYKAAESIQNYIKSIQDRGGGGDGEADYFHERALHERAKREKAELELAVKRGDLHRSEDVEFVMNDMVAAFRSRILALPSKLSPQLIGKMDLAVIQSLLTQEVHEALTELSDYDPHVFHEKNEDYIGQIEDEDD
ncbi:MULTISPECIES: hypothetical protein [Paenibacillus]|uniref:hypothetical protein n=1 Tax=Paenibacillus TaxID=44249 RepID=UPI0022B8FA6C|nr:hypothetical protein [Paenibacillus caseinilyticus]MCZ8520140.1 hypothetical protein [Paenibacillus caseinilyticus]